MLTAIAATVATYLLIGFVRETVDKGKRRSERERRARAAIATQNPGSARLPHEVLGVSSNATVEEIQTAYRKLAGDYHPDKISSSAQELRDLAGQRLREINLAYEALMKQRGER